MPSFRCWLAGPAVVTPPGPQRFIQHPPTRPRHRPPHGSTEATNKERPRVMSPRTSSASRGRCTSHGRTVAAIRCNRRRQPHHPLPLPSPPRLQPSPSPRRLTPSLTRPSRRPQSRRTRPRLRRPLTMPRPPARFSGPLCAGSELDRGRGGYRAMLELGGSRPGLRRAGAEVDPGSPGRAGKHAWLVRLAAAASGSTA